MENVETNSNIYQRVISFPRVNFEKIIFYDQELPKKRGKHSFLLGITLSFFSCEAIFYL